jgi:lipoprotein-releasing system permease protein
MRIAVSIALTHLTSRPRATLVSLGGVILGVAFFLAVSSLMRGSEMDFLRRLIDNNPHITVYDEHRDPQRQPAQLRWPAGAVAVLHVKTTAEPRGIRNWRGLLEVAAQLPGSRAAPVLTDSVVLVFAGRPQGVTLSGVVPALMKQVTTLEEKMSVGSLDDLAADADGVVVGTGLADKFHLHRGSAVSVVTASGGAHTLHVSGIFRTGNASYDEGQAFVVLKRAQSLLGRPDRVNRIVLQLADAQGARAEARRLETTAGYKAVSWVEASEDVLSLLLVRNIIMYSVVSAILVVASFGIYNTLSTIVIEKSRDIAILKAVGFTHADIRTIFLLEGLVIGGLGSLAGLAAGSAIMVGLEQVALRPPGVTEIVHLPIWWGGEQFAIASAFALASAVAAATLPARRASRVHPVDILRGAS